VTDFVEAPGGTKLLPGPSLELDHTDLRHDVQTILQRIAAHDQTAVQECIDRYGGLVWSLARRLCPVGADPEDGVQEIFLALWRGAQSFDPERGDEATFVAVVARRRLIDLRRRLDRHTRGSELPEALEAPGETHVERTEICDDAERARRAMKELRPEQQDVLKLAVYEGLSHQQIATTTGLPLGTVKTHARRGLIRLRELLGATTSIEAEGGAA
jgi:RNA polymerase sigma-70 factor (ECF subfamily)